MPSGTVVNDLESRAVGRAVAPQAGEGGRVAGPHDLVARDTARQGPRIDVCSISTT